MGLRVRPITLGLRRIVMRGTGAGRRIVIRPAVSSEGGGVTVHNDLSGRSAADAHPMSAITDLEPALTDIATKAPLASPTLTGVPTAPTAPPGTDSTQIATTAFVLANAPSSSGFSTTFMLMGA